MGKEKTKKRTPFIIKFLISILSFVLFLSAIVAFAGIFVYKKYDVNVISIVKDLKILNKPINEEESYPNRFTDDDMVDAKSIADTQLAGLIIEKEGGGYIVNGNPGSNLSADIKFTDKQICAILDNQIKNSEQGAYVTIGEVKLGLEIIQLVFENIDETNHTADVNLVIKLDMSEVKGKMKGFPFKMFKKKVPNNLYFSSRFKVIHGNEKFSYSLESIELTINKLNKKQTNEVIRLLDVVLKTGSADELNLALANPLMDGLIGNASNEGFAYSLKKYGANDYDFVTSGGANYFVVKYGI